MERPLKFPGVTNVVSKLADYGFAFYIGAKSEFESQYYSGNDEYIAPELIIQHMNNR